MSNRAKMQDYLDDVARTLATHGNRNVKAFGQAFEKANRVYQDEAILTKVCKEVHDLIRNGLEVYVPEMDKNRLPTTGKLFSARVAIDFACLCADYNSLPNAEPLQLSGIMVYGGDCCGSDVYDCNL